MRESSFEIEGHSLLHAGQSYDHGHQENKQKEDD